MKQYGYCIAAVQGFFKSIALSTSHSLQDTLRLLTLWFDHGQGPEVNDALIEGLKTIQIDNWLQVTNISSSLHDTINTMSGFVQEMS